MGFQITKWTDHVHHLYCYYLNVRHVWANATVSCSFCFCSLFPYSLPKAAWSFKCKSDYGSLVLKKTPVASHRWAHHGWGGQAKSGHSPHPCCHFLPSHLGHETSNLLPFLYSSVIPGPFSLDVRAPSVPSAWSAFPFLWALAGCSLGVIHFSALGLPPPPRAVPHHPSSKCVCRLYHISQCSIFIKVSL